MIIRTFVVDDEPILLRSIKANIEKCNPVFQIVGQATDGATAFESIIKEKPDVVFVDIKMPVVNGIDLIRNLKDAGFECRFIILSGHKEFDYAKQAIRLGVLDYLVKPINTEVLKELLDKIQQDIIMETRKLQYSILDDLIFSNTVKGDLGVFDEYNDYCLVLFCIGAYISHWNFQFSPLYNINKDIKIVEIAEKIFGKETDYWQIKGNLQNESMFLFSGCNEKERIEEISFFIESVKKAVKGVSITIILGDTFRDISQIYSKSKSVYMLMKEGTVFGKSVYLNEKQSDNKKGEDTSAFKEDFTLLQNALNNEQIKQARKMLIKILNDLSEKQYSQKTLTSVLKKLYIIIMQQSDKIKIESDSVEMIVSSSRSYLDITNYFTELFGEVVSADKGVFSDNEQVVNKIEKYIDENYASRISIYDLAEKFNFSYSYLCILFKKYKDISPNEYIIYKRIEKSKELLESESDLNIKDISAFVGYEDPYYFSRIFKSIVGMSPSGFKKSLQG